MAQYTDRKQVVELFRDKLGTDKAWALHGLIVLFNKQTDDEQKLEHTRHVNGCGFNHVDAKKLTSMAKWYLQKGFLTQKQLNVVFHRLPKYAAQLVEHGISIGKIRHEAGRFTF